LLQRISRDAAAAKLGGKPEITRFKGLGRNFAERVQAIHRQGNAPEVLAHGHKVEYAPKVDSQQILSFYMGKNTPERKDYIMENLAVTVEE
jgi:topoisomerase IV subunit B